MVRGGRKGGADVGSGPETPAKSRRCVRSVRCVWAIAALSHLFDTGFGGLEPEVTMKGW